MVNVTTNYLSRSLNMVTQNECLGTRFQLMQLNIKVVQKGEMGRYICCRKVNGITYMYTGMRPGAWTG